MAIQPPSEALADETPPDILDLELAVALKTYDPWRERCDQLGGQSSLQAFLRHVVATVPRYKKHFPESKLSRLELRDFPLITRSEIESNRDAFRSELFLESGDGLFAYTNGTLSKALKVSFDPAGWYDLQYNTYATILRTLPVSFASLEPGEIVISLITDMPFQVRTSVVLPSLRFALLKQFMIGRHAQEDEQVVRYLRSTNMPVLYGKPSTLRQLEALDSDRGSREGRISPKAILVSGENLYEDDRSKLEQWFQARVYNAYIATEGGLMALECGHQSGLHVQQDRVVIEVLGEDGSINQHGTGAILLTNFFNWGHTFVRYEVGDRATIKIDSCPCGHNGPTIVQLWGRELASFETIHSRIDTSVFSDVFKPLAVRQYQITQISRDRFVVKWIPESSNVRVIGELSGAISRALRERLNHLTFEVIPVQSITKRGGKLRRFLREE